MKSRSTLFLTGFVLGVGSVLGIGGAASAMLGSSVFPDVQYNAYYDGAVGELSADGIIRGYDNGRFGPDDYVTRGQVAVMMQRLRNDLLGINVNSSRSTSTSSRSSRSTSSSTSSSSSQSSSSSYITERGQFRFTTSTFRASEINKKVSVSVVRTGGNTGTAKIDYRLIAGTATETDDYVAQSGTITLENKETSKIIVITLKDDTIAEGDETFTIELYNPQNDVGLAQPSTATIVIEDNESSGSSGSSAGSTGSAGASIPSQGLLSLGGSKLSILEGDTLTVTVDRIGGSSGEVSVEYATIQGSAGGSDFTSANGTLTFSSGETSKTFTVATTENTSLTGNKTFTISLTSPTGGSQLGDHPSASVTIVDDDNNAINYGSGSVRFEDDEFTADVDDGFALVHVERIGGALSTISVDYKTNGGSAIAGSNYVAVNGTLTFRPGETQKSFRIPLYDTSSSVTGKTINISITNPQNTTLADSGYGTVTLQN